MAITFINRSKTENIGDLMSSPKNYFDNYNNSIQLDIMFSSRRNLLYRLNYLRILNNHLVIGGGGLFLRDSFIKPLNNLKKLQFVKSKIIWGAGHNSKSSDVNISKYKSEIKGFNLVGIRDYKAATKMKVNFTPCPSCLDPIFGKHHNPRHSIGIIEHEHIKLNNTYNFPSIINNSNFLEVIKFIKTYDKIITNSYHGMYWSLLEGKKVVIIPNSSKFHDFIYTPTSRRSVSEIDFLKDFKKADFNILEDCIEQNLKFKLLVDEKVND